MMHMLSYQIHLKLFPTSLSQISRAFTLKAMISRTEVQVLHCLEIFVLFPFYHKVDITFWIKNE